MKFLLKLFFVLLIMGAAGAAVGVPVYRYWLMDPGPKWRTVEVVRGNLAFEVNATGRVEPLRRVVVGSFVSGQIEELLVDFNDRVTVGQLMAKIDTKLYDAAVRRDEAVLSTRRAELLRAEALLEQSRNEERRAQELRRSAANIISQTEYESLQFARIAREAEVAVAKTAIEQAEANLENSMANLAYTRIIAPVEGVVIDRKIDSGQTIAAQFQTPELFTVAPDLDRLVQIHASVDEADIGLIRQAQHEKRPVRFTVDAYPEVLFDSGKIVQVRLSSTETQNVITYPVIVETPNMESRLLPGMTANLSFEIEAKKDISKIPNAALRFYPERESVHPDDRAILDGDALALEEAREMVVQQSASEKVELGRDRRRRHVWVAEGPFLRAKEVVTGISDNRYSEMVSGDVDVGTPLVVGEQPAA